MTWGQDVYNRLKKTLINWSSFKIWLIKKNFFAASLAYTKKHWIRQEEGWLFFSLIFYIYGCDKSMQFHATLPGTRYLNFKFRCCYETIHDILFILYKRDSLSILKTRNCPTKTQHETKGRSFRTMSLRQNCIVIIFTLYLLSQKYISWIKGKPKLVLLNSHQIQNGFQLHLPFKPQFSILVFVKIVMRHVKRVKHAFAILSTS